MVAIFVTEKIRRQISFQHTNGDTIQKLTLIGQVVSDEKKIILMVIHWLTALGQGKQHSDCEVIFHYNQK